MDAGTFALLKKKIRAVAADVTDLGSQVDTMQTTVNALGEGLDYKGSVAAVGSLPSGATTGDAYTVTGAGNALYVWDGSNWIEWYTIATNAQVDAIFA